MERFSVKGNTVIGKADHMIYGQMVEHAYWSVHLGLCAQMLDNGGFERGEDVSFYDEGLRVAQGWKLVSTDVANKHYGLLDTENPKNATYAQKIVVQTYNSGHIRVQQSDISVKEQCHYHGWVYARGSVPSLKVRLLSLDKQTIAEQTIALDSEWRKYDFVLTASESCESAIFAFVLEGEGSVWLDQASLYPSESYHGHGTRADIVEKYKALKPAFLRWPGGAYLIWHNWKHTIGPIAERLYDYGRNMGRDDGIQHYREWAPNNFGIDEFIQLCRDVGAEPMINVCMLYPLQDTLDLIEYCNGGPDTEWGRLRAENGHEAPYNVRYWIVDNEPKRVPEQKGFTPDSYAHSCGAWAKEMRKADPSISVAAMGDYDLEKNLDCREMPFTTQVIERSGKDIDNLCLHAYPDQTFGGPLQGLPYKMGETLEMIGATIAGQNFSHPVPLAVTEWNMQCFALEGGNLAQAIDSAQFYLTLERLAAKGIVDQACMCQMCVNTDRYRGYWLRSAMVQIDHVTSWVSPMYHVVQMFSNAFQPNVLAIEGQFPLVSSTDISGYTFPGFDMVAAKSEDGKTLVLKCLNNTVREDYPIQIRIDDVQVAGDVKVTELTADKITDINTRYSPDTVAPRSYSLEMTDNAFTYICKRATVSVFELSIV